MHKWLIIALASGTMCSISTASDQKIIDSSDVQMAEEFGAMAARTLARKDLSVSLWSESEALAMAAHRLNPAQVRWADALAHYATSAADTPMIVQADKDLLALQPGNRAAQLQLIDIYLAQMETADQKDAYLKALISKQSLGNDVRSYAAMALARVLMERSETASARAMIGQAINLNPLNVEALRAQYAIVQQNGSVLEKAIASLGLLRANPADPMMIWNLAHLLSQSGLEKESINFFELAVGAMPRNGMAIPEELLADYFSAIYLSGDTKNLDDVMEKTLSNDPDAPQIWMVKVAIEKANNSPHLQNTIAKANVAAFNAIQTFRHHLGSTEATTRPVDLGEPVALGDTTADVARIASDNSGQLRRAYKQVVSDWAWLNIFDAQKPDDAAPMVQFLQRILPTDDPVLHRLQGWTDYVKGDVDGARAQFSAAGDDALSKMGLVEIERKTDPKAASSQARKLLSENSAGLLGTTLYADLKGEGVALIPSNQSQAVLEQLNRFPVQYLSILMQPQSFYSVHIDPIKVSYQYDEPILVRVAIQNLTGIDLTVGADALIHPFVLLDAQQRGIGDQLYRGVAYAQLNSALLLRGGDEISQIVRIDQGDFGLVLLNNPEAQLQYTLMATTNPVPVKDQIYISLGGFKAQMPRVFEREASSLSDQTGRDHVMRMLGGEDGGAKIRATVLMANYATQYLNDPNANAAQKKAGADLLHVLDENTKDATGSVAAMADFAKARVQAGGQKWDGLEKLAAENDWEKQLLAAFASSAAPVDVQKKICQSLTTNGHDPIVQKYAAAHLQTLEHPTTQPLH